jgi:hypothetical protein
MAGSEICQLDFSKMTQGFSIQKQDPAFATQHNQMSQRQLS